MTCQTVQKREFAYSLRGYPAVRGRLKSPHIACEHFDIRELKLAGDDAQKISTALSTLDECDVVVRKRECHDDTRQPRTGTEVQNAVGGGEVRLYKGSKLFGLEQFYVKRPHSRARHEVKRSVIASEKVGVNRKLPVHLNRSQVFHVKHRVSTVAPSCSRRGAQLRRYRARRADAAPPPESLDEHA